MKRIIPFIACIMALLLSVILCVTLWGMLRHEPLAVFPVFFFGISAVCALFASVEEALKLWEV